MSTKPNWKSIGLVAVIVLFGLWAIPNIVLTIKEGRVTKGSNLDQVEGNTKDASRKILSIGAAPAFELTDVEGQPFSSAELANQVYVLEFFFSTCPSICPVMNGNMKKLEQRYLGNPKFNLVSITINPEYDTPAVLKEHKQHLGVSSSKWHFLTGDKKYIYDLAAKFNLYVGESKDAPGGFEHSGLFALVDRNGNIRSRKDAFGNPKVYYDGTDQAEMQMLVEDLTLVLKE